MSVQPYQNPKLSPEERAEDLIGRMTLREKVGQLTQRLYGFDCFVRKGKELRLSEEFCREVDRYSGLGTLYGLYRADPWSKADFETGLDGELAIEARNMAQRYVMEHSRLGIPMLMSTECPHGHQALDGYLLPVNLAAGCSFDPALLAETAKVSAAQLKQMGVDLALVSLLDVLRDPRWGRSEECFGEDPYLASEMAGAVVQAMQGMGMNVVAKHMCAQGETTGGVNASAARIGERELREIHLPPVKRCVEAGVSSFMAAYNEIDGIYCHGNHWLLTDLLRGEYGFEGFVMSDGCAIDQLDAVTGDRMASGALALNAGVDMGLWDTGFEKLEEAVAAGLVEETVIDRAVKRILVVKFRRGLFESPYVPQTLAWQNPGKDSDARRRLTEQTPVLLKNTGAILPMDFGKPMRLGLIGPNADDVYHQLGDYTPPMRPGTVVTVKTGMEKLLRDKNSPVELVYRRGCPMFTRDEAELTEAVEAMADCDAIVAVVGGSSSRFSGQGEFDTNGAMKKQDEVTMDCGENIDDAYLKLPGDQLRLLHRLKETGKPMVVILLAGRPYEMAELDACSDALVCSFYPGPEGGTALAELLFGEIEPAGRLSVSLPDQVGQLPVYYNAKDSYRSVIYYNSQKPPRYRFGDGLGYTEFAFTLEKAPDADGGALIAKVENVGGRPGYAVPQLYIHRTQGVSSARVRQLCGFRKVRLEPGQSARVEIPIPEDALMQWDSGMHPVCPPGKVCLYLCDSGVTHLSGDFQVKP